MTEQEIHVPENIERKSGVKAPSSAADLKGSAEVRFRKGCGQKEMVRMPAQIPIQEQKESLTVSAESVL